MNPFTFIQPPDVGSAIKELDQDAKSQFLGGGTNLIDLMKMGVATPQKLIDIHRLPLGDIVELPNGKGVRIGAAASNSAVAEHPLILQRYPVLSQALLAGASPQLRNMATVGGNLLQKTRCYYYYDPALGGCNKRTPGTGCSAIGGFNRIHAILGQSEQCIATNPSDMNVALTTLDAVVHVQGPQGARSIPILEFHRLPGNTPEKDTNLAPGELITAVDLPSASWMAKSHYLKMRDRASYAFALVSAAVALEVKDGKIKNCRISLGGVSHKPWRSFEAEAVLTGASPEERVFANAADAALKNAKGYPYNTFKIELARITLAKALAATVAIG